MRRFGLLGRHIAYSFSPKLHHCFFKEFGFDAIYDLIDLKDQPLTKEVWESIKTNYDGINVTIPFKTEVMDYLEWVDESAIAIGAVNTVYFDENISKGYNTDFDGFLSTIEKFNQIHFNSAYILGTGGASKVVYYVLKQMGIETIKWVTRKPQTGSDEITYEALANEELEKALLVNTTPVGSKQFENQSPIALELVSSFTAVIDLIYNPTETELLKQAKVNQIPYENGLHMLKIQANKAECIWWSDKKIEADCFLKYEI